jgi:hypothetical protein
MKRTNLLMVGLVIASTIFAFYPQLFKLYKLSARMTCELNDQFKADTGTTGENTESIAINDNGTVRYFKDDFSGYAEHSKIIDQFDDLNNLGIKGSFQETALSPDRISGKYALSFDIKPDKNQTEPIVIRKNLAEPTNLEKWNDSGILSMWMKIENRKGITGVGLKIGDKDNNYREFREIKNLQANIPNNYDSNDVYPDIALPNSNSTSSIWSDFWLNKGWNYLFWKTDKENHSDSGIVDIKNITWFEITLNENEDIANQQILVDDFRIQEGIQKDTNSLGGIWYPPDNEPQNGIFDLDKVSKEKYTAKLLNVRQTQDTSNEDHGRMVLRYGTPLNFSLRTRFSLTNFPKDSRDRADSLFRVAYDFDSSYDPGHDWFGSFISLEWNKFGLTAVIPIEKDSVQEWEPKNEKTVGTSVDFTPEENVLYEIQLTVRGQKAISTIYEVGNGCLILKGQTEYEFRRPRYGNEKRYPFCLEVTGNLKAYIYDVEIKEL